MSDFNDEAWSRIREIEKSLESGNIRLFTVHVHGLKSAAFAIGADKLSDAAQALEKAGSREDVAFIELHTNEFRQSTETLIDSIENWKKTVI